MTPLMTTIRMNLNQAHAAEGRVPGFLKLFLFVLLVCVCMRVCVCVCVCVRVCVGGSVCLSACPPW